MEKGCEKERALVRLRRGKRGAALLITKGHTSAPRQSQIPLRTDCTNGQGEMIADEELQPSNQELACQIGVPVPETIRREGKSSTSNKDLWALLPFQASSEHSTPSPAVR